MTSEQLGGTRLPWGAPLSTAQPKDKGTINLFSVNLVKGNDELAGLYRLGSADILIHQGDTFPMFEAGHSPPVMGDLSLIAAKLPSNRR